MNLGTARIVVIVALVVAGAVVLANGFSDTGEAAAPSGSVTPSGSVSPGSSPSPTTQSPATTPSPQAPGDVTFMALNGTEVSGAGAAAQDKLTNKGYVAVQGSPDDAPSKGVETTTIYYRGGQDAAQNKSDATEIADKYFHGAEIKKLDTSFDQVVPSDAMIVVVVGQDYADSLVQ